MKARILVVDDSGLARRRARTILEGAGFEVLEAEDGIAALESYFVAKPDLVLLDLVMKGMYGLDVLSKLRELDPDAKVKWLPPNGFTGKVRISSHESAAHIGCRSPTSARARAIRLAASISSWSRTNGFAGPIGSTIRTFRVR